MARVKTSYEDKHLSIDSNPGLDADVETTTNVITPAVTVRGIESTDVSGATDTRQVFDTGRVVASSDDILKLVLIELRVMNMLLSDGLGIVVDLDRIRNDMNCEE